MNASWVMQSGPLPPGVARVWLACDRGSAYAGIFQPEGTDRVLLAYHVAGEPRARAEKHPGFTAAQERATLLLNELRLIGRPLGL